MKIKRLVIENFKSIERIELIEPNPFTVFVGPNGSGKSNIFEALEFFNLASKMSQGTVENLFGGRNHFTNRNNTSDIVSIEVDLGDKAEYRLIQSVDSNNHRYHLLPISLYENSFISPSGQQFLVSFSRLFIGQKAKQKLNYSTELQLTFSADNIEPVLRRILTDSILRNEIFEWLDLFVPGFKAVEVDDRNELHWFEEFSPAYFTKDLISDGTYNILALLTAVYQIDKPQFICIEEPENGLHPQVLMTLVEFFRQQCEEKGHYIWLNTHSESLVRKLRAEEIILVNKREGATQTKQVGKRNLYDLPIDEAWLTGALGGGLAW